MERDRTGGRSGWHTSDFNSHAHVERDSIVFNQIFQPRNFNSHAHVERDALYSVMDLRMSISTHTLTWSVTRSTAGRPDRPQDFNSHAHVERDDTPYSALSAGNNFNSHAHVERDDYLESNGDYTFNFNSHAHVERDRLQVLSPQ